VHYATAQDSTGDRLVIVGHMLGFKLDAHPIAVGGGDAVGEGVDKVAVHAGDQVARV